MSSSNIFSAYDNKIRSYWIMCIMCIVSVTFIAEGFFTMDLKLIEKQCIDNNAENDLVFPGMSKQVLEGANMKIAVGIFALFLLIFYVSATAKEPVLRRSLATLSALPLIVYYIMDGIVIKKFNDDNKGNACYDDVLNQGFYKTYFKHELKWIFAGFLFFIAIIATWRAGAGG